MKYEEIEARGSFDFPISYYYLNKNHLRYTMRCHWHQEPELIHIISGTLHVTIGGETFIGMEGDVFYVNSTHLHAATPTDCIYECTVCELALLGAECHRLISEYAFPSKLSGRAKDFALYILSTLANKPSGWKFSVKGAFHALYGEFLSQGEMQPRPAMQTEHTVKKAITYIEKHFSEPITLSMLSSQSKLSPKYFERIFKEMTGKSPIRYLNSYRIYKAENQLIMTSDTVTEIAYETGFNDLSYFIKLFKAKNGVSPTSFRNNKKGTHNDAFFPEPDSPILR